MRKADAIGVGMGLVLLAVASCQYLGEKRRQREELAFECSYRLRYLYNSYIVFKGDGGTLVPEILSTSSFTNRSSLPVDLPAKVFGRLCLPNILHQKNLVCPRDVRRPAETLANLNNANISYFLGVYDGFDDSETILAGNRNFTDSTGVVRSAAELSFGWRPNQGLHGTNGYLLFGDGSVRLTTSAQLRSAMTNGDNQHTVFLIP
jgi:hypothetical protein